MFGFVLTDDSCYHMRLNVAFIEDLLVFLPMRLVLRASIIQEVIRQDLQ